jgi:hypothetical protein
VTMEDRHPPQQMLLGKVVVYLQKTESKSLTVTPVLVSTQSGLRTLTSDLKPCS